MSIIIIPQKVIITRITNFLIKEERIVIVLLDNIKIRIICNDIC